MVVKSCIQVKDFLNKTKMKSLDYVVNPYVSCPHKCVYCYASYMSSFSKHTEGWGNFLDVKSTNKKINPRKVKDKKVMISTVTDPYNKYEEKYCVTRSVLEQFVGTEAKITILTKSDLVLRDVDILKQLKSVEVGLTICMLDEQLKKKLEPKSPSIAQRIEALKVLKQNGIRTVCYISPFIPEVTDFEKIIEVTKEFTDEYRFEFLNMKGNFKYKIFNFIKQNYPEQISLYGDLYNEFETDYFEKMTDKIKNYCNKNNIKYNVINKDD